MWSFVAGMFTVCFIQTNRTSQDVCYWTWAAFSGFDQEASTAHTSTWHWTCSPEAKKGCKCVLPWRQYSTHACLPNLNLSFHLHSLQVQVSIFLSLSVGVAQTRETEGRNTQQYSDTLLTELNTNAAYARLQLTTVLFPKQFYYGVRKCILETYLHYVKRNACNYVHSPLL
jgi:hypothetical protein